MTEVRHKLYPHLMALAIFSCLALLIAWPMAPDGGVIGGIGGWAGRFRFAGDEEAWLHVWHLWWVKTAFQQSTNPFWSNLLFYPDGIQLYVQTLSIPNALLTLPILLLTTPEAAYNAAVLLAFTLTGYGGFLLARIYAPGLVTPILCGGLVAACPFHIGQLQNSHLNLLSMQWIVFYLYALVLFERRPTWGRAAVAAGALLLVMLGDWYYALVCLTSTIPWMLARLLMSSDRLSIVKNYLRFGGITLLACMPLAIGMLAVRDQLPANGGAPGVMLESYITGSSVDLLGLLFPSAYHPLWGTTVQQLLDPISPGFAPSGWYVAAGWTLLACTSLGLRTAWHKQPQLCIAGLVAWVLSLGSTCRIAGYDTRIPMPYQLLEHVSLLSAARKPAMFAVFVIVVMIVPAALGIEQLRARLAPHWEKIFLFGVIALGIFELWLPAQRIYLEPERAAIFDMVRQRPGAVADLPLDSQETSRTLRDQMLHGQPIIGGYIARRPAYDILGMSWYRVIDLFQQPDPTDIVSSDPATLAAMQCYAPIRHIIVRKDLIGAGSRRILKQTLASMTDQSVLRYEDERYLWYELPPLSDQCAPFLIIGSGWYDTEFDSERHWCWGSEQNDLWAVNPFNHSIVATISITGEAFNAKVPLEIWNQGHLLASWPIVREQRHYTWILTLLPGRNRLTLRLPTTRDPHSGRFLSFSAERMTISITGQPATRP